MEHPFPYKDIEQALAGNDAQQLKEAGEICRTFVETSPDNAAYLNVMGLIEYKLGHAGAASKWFKKTLALKDNIAGVHFNYALALAAQKKTAEAIAAFRRAIEAKPDYIQAYYKLGNLLHQSGDGNGAIEAYKKALALKPDFPEVLNNLGVVFKQQGALREAAKYYHRALSIRPNDPVPLDNLGVICFALGNLDAAKEYHCRALALNPDFPSALNNLGLTLRQQGAFAEGISLLTKALTLQPNFPEALNNLGNALKDSGMLPEAISAYEQAIALKGEDPEFHHNLALALLAVGRFEEGWSKYEWRWQSNQLAAARHDMTKPLWRGEAAEGRTLLIRAEQGFGDTLQFCRYAPLAAARGLRVVLEVQPALVRLMESLDGVEQVIAQGQPLPEFDLYCPMMSLPMAFHTQLDTVPGDIPYLSAKQESIDIWKNRLANSGNKRKVGLVWAGAGRQHSTDIAAVDRRRSIIPVLLAPLMDIAGIQYYSLQKGGTDAPAEFGLIDLMNECRDFADTAALIANLDLIISVDTAVVHLAGALGKPVWVLDRFDTCWRWLRDREDSPWYPTLRLFRQHKPGDWMEVVERVRSALREEYPAACLRKKTAMTSARFVDEGVKAVLSGKRETAFAYFRQALAIDPNDPMANNNLGVVLQDKGALTEAEESFRRAIKAKPDYAEAYSNLGIVQGIKGLSGEAGKMFRQAIKLAPDCAEYYNNLGAEVHQAGLYSQAAELFRWAIRLNPDYVEALNNLGSVLRQSGHYREAEECLRRAITLDTAYGKAYNNLGLVLRDIHQLEEAEVCLRRAVQLCPSDAEVIHNHGILLKECGKLEEAKACLELAVEQSQV